MGCGGLIFKCNFCQEYCCPNEAVSTEKKVSIGEALTKVKEQIIEIIVLKPSLNSAKNIL